jgi:Cu/Ag efflux protein CusF
VSIDSRTATVTARDKATNATFRFAVKDHALLAKLHVGTQVSADLKGRVVSVDGAAPCCEIISLETPEASGGVKPASPPNEMKPAEPPAEIRQQLTPCCAITAIDPAHGVVTARFASRTFRFAVKDPALFKTLSVGQQIRADLVRGQVAVTGIAPCCEIIKE